MPHHHPSPKEIANLKPKRRGEGGGRKKGSINKNSRILKDALLLAAEAAGDDLFASKKAKQDKLVGYLRWMALKEVSTFASLLGRVIPLQITVEKVEVHYETVEDIQRDILARQIPIEKLTELLRQMPATRAEAAKLDDKRLLEAVRSTSGDQFEIE